MEWNKVLPMPRIIEKKNGELILGHIVSIEMNELCDATEFKALKILKLDLEERGIKTEIRRTLNSNESGDIRIQIVNKDQELDNLDNKDEAYIISVEEDYIELKALTSMGIFYGIQTLRQVLESGTGKINRVKVSDYPEFKVRGFYHDITRGKVPTLEKLKRIVDDISKYKINQFQLYVEHVFPFKGHEEIWAQKDPITPGEIMELDLYCLERNVELVPSLASFGHLYHLLCSQKFSHLSELEKSKDSKFSWVDRMRHHTVDVSNDESISVVTAMIEEFLPLFSSDKFNICCDETFDLGKGRSRNYVEEMGRGKAYLEFLNKLITVVKSNGKVPMFWGDIILNYPELLDEIEQDVICLNWNYSPEATDETTKTLKKSGRRFYNCPAVWGWDRFMNDIEGSFKNIEKMVKYSKENEVEGILCTDWGDYGHVNWYAASKPGMIYSAALSWNAECEMSQCKKLISEAEYGTDDMVNILEELGNQQYISFMEIVWWMENKRRSTSLLLDRPELIEKYMLNKDEKKLKMSYRRAMEIERILRGKLHGTQKIKNKKDISRFIISARMIAILNSLYINIKEHDYNEKVEQQVHTQEELIKEINVWLNDFKAAWREDNKESELHRVEEFFKDVCSYLRCQKIAFK